MQTVDFSGPVRQGTCYLVSLMGSIGQASLEDTILMTLFGRYHVLYVV